MDRRGAGLGIIREKTLLLGTLGAIGTSGFRSGFGGDTNAGPVYVGIIEVNTLGLLSLSAIMMRFSRSEWLRDLLRESSCSSHSGWP